MKKVFVLVLGLFLIACGSDEKKKTDPKQDEKKTEEVKQEKVEVTYPKLTDVPPQLNYIFDNGYEFDEDIKVDFIALESKGGDKYQLIYGLEEGTNLERLKGLKVSAVFYAKDPTLFKDEIYRKRKSRQVPAICEVLSLDGANVLAQNLEILPKEFTQVKFYFYDDQGVVNKKMMTVRNIKMPK